MLHQKQCFKCEEIKPIDEFYRHKAMGDGYLNKCKDCAKQDVRKRYSEKRNQILEYEKKRALLPHRVEARKIYASTERGKEVNKKSHRRSAEKYPERVLARTKLNNAIRSGKIQRPNKCSVCMTVGKIQAHHDNYNEPFVVKWLCTSCHRKEHKYG
jgi:hypothetical protein